MENTRHWVVAGLLLLAGVAVAADVAIEEEIASLVRDLGSPRYKTRERASKRLWEIGQPARSALEAAAKSKDPEVAMRAETLLRRIGRKR